jgi:AGCS family alanine or glycine:cation symporter
VVVPLMGVSYLLLVLVITLMNIDQVPSLIYQIVSSAFGLNEAAAGTFAAALKNGIQRGLYSNEAGAGSVPQAAASASPNPNHPAVQGYIQMLGVFLDTMVLCTCTAIVILLAGVGNGEMEGIRLTQDAMSVHVGEYGVHFVAVAICLFAFTSIVANYAYAESNLHLFKLDTFAGRSVLIMVFLVMIYWGTGANLKEVWAAADMAFGLMALINISAIILLSKTIKNVSSDYLRQRQQDQEIHFSQQDCQIQGETEERVWD